MAGRFPKRVMQEIVNTAFDAYEKRNGIKRPQHHRKKNYKKFLKGDKRVYEKLTFWCKDVRGIPKDLILEKQQEFLARGVTISRQRAVELLLIRLHELNCQIMNTKTV